MTNEETLRELWIRKLPQAILGAMEYRGFYDCGKYLDDDIIEKIEPIIAEVLLASHQQIFERLKAELPESANERNSAKVSATEILTYDQVIAWNLYRTEVLAVIDRVEGKLDYTKRKARNHDGSLMSPDEMLNGMY